MAPGLGRSTALSPQEDGTGVSNQVLVVSGYSSVSSWACPGRKVFREVSRLTPTAAR